MHVAGARVTSTKFCNVSRVLQMASTKLSLAEPTSETPDTLAPQLLSGNRLLNLAPRHQKLGCR